MNDKIAMRTMLSAEQTLIGSMLAADWSAQSLRIWDISTVRNIEWQALPLLAARHKVRPMLAAALREAGWPGPAKSIREQVLAAESTCTRNTIAQLSLLTSIVEHARARGIRVLTLKGPVLAQYLFANPFIRESFDLDVLVHPDDLNGMAEIFTNARVLPILSGQPLSPLQEVRLQRFNKHKRFQHADSGIVVECHYSLDHNSRRLNTDFEELWEHRTSVVIAGQIMAMPGTRDLTQYLCAHAARHLWDRWKWIADFAALVRMTSEEDLGECREWTRASNNCVLFDASLLLTTAITGAPLPDALNLKAVRNKQAVTVAGRAFRLALVRPHGNQPPSRLYQLRQLFERLRLEPSWRHILSEMAVLAHREEDWRAYRLPDRLIWAYFPLRLVSYVRRVSENKVL